MAEIITKQLCAVPLTAAAAAAARHRLIARPTAHAMTDECRSEPTRVEVAEPQPEAECTAAGTVGDGSREPSAIHIFPTQVARQRSRLTQRIRNVAPPMSYTLSSLLSLDTPFEQHIHELMPSTRTWPSRHTQACVHEANLDGNVLNVRKAPSSWR